MSQITSTQDRRVVVLEKDVVASTFEESRKRLQELLDSGCRELVIDLHKVQIVDSRGLALFMLCQNSLSRIGGRLTLVTQNQDLLHLFRVMRMDRHITITEQVPA
jgi:anti-sigma B factor antagonist